MPSEALQANSEISTRSNNCFRFKSCLSVIFMIPRALTIRRVRTARISECTCIAIETTLHFSKLRLIIGRLTGFRTMSVRKPFSSKVGRRVFVFVPGRLKVAVACLRRHLVVCVRCY